MFYSFLLCSQEDYRNVTKRGRRNHRNIIRIFLWLENWSSSLFSMSICYPNKTTLISPGLCSLISLRRECDFEISNSNWSCKGNELWPELKRRHGQSCSCTYIQKRQKTLVWKDTYTSVFIAALFTKPRHGIKLNDHQQMNIHACVLSHSVVSNSLWPHGLHPARFLCPWESPEKILEWVAIPFSRESSQPRDWTQASHIAGRFFPSECTYIYIYIYT